MVKYVLNQHVIDAPVKAGRWSPLMSYVPGALGASLTGNHFVAVLSVGLLFVLYGLARIFNSPSLYRYGRVVSLPARIAWFILVILQLDSIKDALNVIGFIIALGAFVVDLILGDLATVLDYRYTCNYEVIRILPNRVFICKRKGAAHYEDEFGSRGEVHEWLT